MPDGCAVVTGAGRGIGREIATALASRGWPVVLAARSASEITALGRELVAAGGSAIAHPTDITRAPAVEELLAAAQARFGSVDLVVNNAGGHSAIGPVWITDPTEWWSDVELNLKGAYLVMRAALPSMVERGSGRIINIVSLLGTQAAPMTSAYGCAKAALIMLSESAEVSLRGTGVHVFAMSPGLVSTPGFEATTRGPRGRQWMPEFQDIAPEAMVSPKLAADLAVRIAEGRADELGGRMLHVNSDLDLLCNEARSIATEEQLVLRIRK